MQQSHFGLVRHSRKPCNIQLVILGYSRQNFKAYSLCFYQPSNWANKWPCYSGRPERKSEKQKRKRDLWATLEYLLSFFNQSPVLSPCAAYPPCLLGLKAAAVFVWSTKTLLPLLAFNQGCMGGWEWEGEGGCLSRWVSLELRVVSFSFIWTYWSNQWQGDALT